MKQQKVFFGVIVVITSFLVGAGAMTQQTRPAQSTAQITVTDQEKASQRLIESRRPGEHRRTLNVLIGRWNTTWKIWTRPDSEPSVSTGTTTFAWSRNGRFVEGKFSGTLKGAAPGKQGPPHDIPYTGVFTLEYDTRGLQYTSSWTNSLEPTKVSSLGIARANAASRIGSIELRGTCECQTGGVEEVFRSVMDVSNPNRVTEEGFVFDSGGKEFKATEIVYTRIGSQPTTRLPRTKM